MSYAIPDHPFPRAAPRDLLFENFQPEEEKAVKLVSGERYLRTGGCTKGCGACCEFMFLPINPDYRERQDEVGRDGIFPLDPRRLRSDNLDDWLGWLGLHNITVELDPTREVFEAHVMEDVQFMLHIDDRLGRFDAYLPISCSALEEDKTCSLFGTPERPNMCSGYPHTPYGLKGVEDVCTYRFIEVQPDEDWDDAIERVFNV